MKTKAIENLDSAQLLIDRGYYTASVHCSYYAVFQYMKYMLATTADSPISFDDQDAHTGESSHEYILIETRDRINANATKKRDFTNAVRNLKQDRVEADYHQKQFTVDESLDCKANADGLITKLKTYFGNI